MENGKRKVQPLMIKKNGMSGLEKRKVKAQGSRLKG